MRFLLHPIVIALCFGLAQTGAQAQTKEVADPCGKFGGYELVNCLQRALVEADRALNAAWRKAEAIIPVNTDLSADQKKAWQADLLAAQRAWLAYRDANCKFDLIGAEWTFGSGTTAAQTQCLLTTTRSRTKELLDRYSGS